MAVVEPVENHQVEWRYCPQCRTPLTTVVSDEDSGPTRRLRCPACGFTHWNNPTPVLAAVVEHDGKILLARNAAWTQNLFALITGFMEAGETPQAGIAREIHEETNLEVQALELVGAYGFERKNQIIVAFHAVCTGRIKLSPELAEYRLFDHGTVRCWPSTTGHALADWLRSRGHEPVYMEWPKSDGVSASKPR